MAEMAREVEAVSPDGRRAPAPPRPVSPPPAPARPPEPPVLTALPAVTPRGQVVELCGSMALAVLFAGLGTTLWAALGGGQFLAVDLGSLFFLTVAACWAILVPGKFWTDRRGDSWTRRLIMMALGALLGVAAWWLDGWSFAAGTADPAATVPLGRIEAAYFAYYALAFFALRWWRMTGRRRPHRFSFAPLLGSLFWGLVLLLLVRPHGPGVVVLVLASAIVQLVSPWDQPPPPPAKRVRLRYA
jgi:hypothetical protein